MNSWERIKPSKGSKGESDPAWEAFQIFRDMPWREKDAKHRTIKAVADELKKTVQIVHRWSGMWNWRERAVDFDKWMDVRT